MGADAGTLIGVADATDWRRSWQDWLDAAIAREVERLRARYELSLDEFRGLYISDEHVDQLLAASDRGAPTRPPPLPAAGDSPLGRVQQRFDLTPPETAALFVVLAPEFDGRYETLFAYLNDDVTRRYATIDLLTRLADLGAADTDARARLLASGLLVSSPRAPGAPWRATGVRLTEAARRFLLDGDSVAVPDRTAVADLSVRRVAAAIAADRVRRVVLVDGRIEDARPVAHAIAACCGRRVVDAGNETGEQLRESVLSARLHDAIVFVACESAETMGEQLEVALEAPVVTLVAVPRSTAWRTAFEAVDHEIIRLAPPPASVRAAYWRDALAEHGAAGNEPDVQAVGALFALHRSQIRRAAAAAARSDAVLDFASLARSARGQCTSALDELATRVPAVHSWSDLVLPPPTERRLRELATAVRFRDRIFGEWRFERAAGGRSLRALFSGGPGTGKTLAASVLGYDLGLDVYRVDLSAVVSKYIGETEKNLERIFTAADGSNAILFFDEADALFGKRSEVKDAHDRYANIEVAYLLQRVENYDGVLILATNMAGNMDEAFSRRLHFEINFPRPDEQRRRELWTTLIPDAAPLDDDVDIVFLARQFSLTGGEIRNVALSAAFLAAHDDSAICMHHVVRAVARQRRKQGKMPTASEFKQYLSLVSGEGA